MPIRQSFPLLLAAVAVLPIFTRCDTTINFTDKRDLAVNIPAGTTASAASQDQLVDLSQDKEIADKLSAVKSIDVVSIWLSVTNVDPSNLAKFAKGTLDVKGPADTDTWENVGAFPGAGNAPLAIGQGAKIEIIPTAAQQSVINQVRGWATTKPYQFHIRFSGAFLDANMQPLAQGPVNFTVNEQLELNATVGL